MSEVKKESTGQEAGGGHSTKDSNSDVLRVEMREPSQHFRESVDRNLRIGRAAAAAAKKK